MMINSSFVPLGIKLEGINTPGRPRNDIYSSLFSRKLRMLCHWQVFWLVLLLTTFPSLPNWEKQWFKKDQKLIRTHSIGECSGFSPDSLSIRRLAEPMRHQNTGHRE